LDDRGGLRLQLFIVHGTVPRVATQVVTMKRAEPIIVSAILLVASGCAQNKIEAPKLAAQPVFSRRDESPVSRRAKPAASKWGTDLTLEEFREASGGYRPRVERSNLMPIQSLRDDWADYIARVHTKLHVQFAGGLLGTLPTYGALGNPNLVTKVEIVVRADGSVERFGIVQRSGSELYDYGVFSVIRQSAPYPPPPPSIHSPDSLTYLHWDLHRNESQCGTWNCEPFILRVAPTR